MKKIKNEVCTETIALPKEVLLTDPKRRRRRPHQILNDVQLGPDSTITPTERRWRQNAKKACSSCPGFCCLAFAIGIPSAPPEVGDSIQERLSYNADKTLDELLDLYDREEIHRTLMQKRGGILYCYTEEGKRRIAQLEEEWYNLDFFSTRLVKLESLDPGIMEEQKRKGSAYCTCKEFDVANRRCKVYNDRPSICRRFLCGPSTVGRVPAVNRMLAQPKFFPQMKEIFKLQLRTKIKNERQKEKATS